MTHRRKCDRQPCAEAKFPIDARIPNRPTSELMEEKDIPSRISSLKRGRLEVSPLKKRCSLEKNGASHCGYCRRLTDLISFVAANETLARESERERERESERIPLRTSRSKLRLILAMIFFSRGNSP